MSIRSNFLKCIMIVLWTMTSVLSAQDAIKIGVNNFIHDTFSKFVGKESPENITNFKSPHASRGVVELILIHKAFKAGNITVPVKLEVFPNSERGKLAAASGLVTLFAETIWEDEIDAEQCFITDPVIMKGEFEKGIFTTPTNSKALSVKTFDDLKNLNAVIPKFWERDWQIMLKVNPKNLQSVSKLESIYKLLDSGRADFTFLEFSNKADFSMELEGIKLIPIPNMKIGLNANRCWGISKKSTNAKQIYNAIQNGIKTLRATGAIRKAYEESGFFNPAVKDWQKEIL